MLPVELSAGQGLEVSLDLARAGIGQRRTVVEQQRGYGAIARVRVLDELSTIGILLDVHLGVLDAGAVELGLEPSAVPAPGRGEHRQLHGNGNPVRHAPIPVSYTHLRAHETDSYLVC